MNFQSIVFFLLAVGSLKSASSNSESPFFDLFATDDFSQWSKVGGGSVGFGWTVEDGIVHRRMLSGDIITKQKFKNFELSFEWKISEGGNSGVKYRTRGRLGLEYQVLDDEKHRDNKNPTHRAASLYDLVAAPHDKPINPVGTWNLARIVAKGNSILHFLNGEKVVEIEWGSNEWKQKFQESKYSKNQGFGSWEGPILLQDHMDPVWFKNLKIRKL